MDSDIGRSLDRISKLPDHLLCHILSSLPTKYAVGTSILSTRWRYLWTGVPKFDFDDTTLFQEYAKLSEDRKKEVKLSFQYFVNRVLLLSDAPCFQKFHLYIGSVELFDHIDTWICAAIKRNVQDLKLLNSIDTMVELPHMLFTSKTLEVLTLCQVLLNVPRSVLLPSLKILKLDSVEYENEDSLHKLFSGCPVLEEVYIERWILDTQRVLDISVPTLKHLTVRCDWNDLKDELDDSDESDDEERCKLVIDTPQLESLYLYDRVSENFMLRNLSSLSKASVIVGHTRGASIFIGDGLRIYKLLSGIPNVKFLEAFLSFDNDVNDYMLPTFHNLTQLRFGAEGFGSLNLKLLADFLQCSPNLEVLILKGNRLEVTERSWNPPEQVPSCLLSHLKKIQIEEFTGKDYELEVIEYLLKNAELLKKMTIDCQYSDSCFCGEIAEFPRGSRRCKLNLLL